MNYTITFLTKPPSLLSKTAIKSILASMLKKQRGPQAVLESLKRGCRDIGQAFQVNPKSGKESDIVHVISGVDTLRYALQLKKQGKIRKLLAGPNIVISPDDHGKIMRDNAIDAIILPSQWAKNFYVSTDHYYQNKIFVVPNGVEDPGSIINSEHPQFDFLIYKKTFPQSLLEHIIKILDQKKLSYRFLAYGSFKSSEFYDLLERSKAMIYLSESESQGLALHEAWMRDVPTLVWNRGYWQNEEMKWQDDHISAPYLNEESGLFFKDAGDFNTKLAEFLDKHNNNCFSPRSYSLKYFTDSICAKSLVHIIKSL